MVRWKIGVTTAPRQPNFLDQTLTSLHEAGWNYEDICVYSEPGSADPTPPVVRYLHQLQQGAWCNWRFVLHRLSLSDCDYVAIVQDDIVCRPGLSAYLEKSMDSKGLYSPYVTKRGSALVNEGWTLNHAGWSLCGACFFAMTRSVAIWLDTVLPLSVRENKHIDAYVGKILKEKQLPLYAHVPSLVEHLADAHSTLGYRENLQCRTAFEYSPKPIGEK